jgi:hypothetical protein
MFQAQLPKAQAIRDRLKGSRGRYGTALRASSASAGRRRWMHGRRLFLTLGGHQLIFALTCIISAAQAPIRERNLWGTAIRSLV